MLTADAAADAQLAPFAAALVSPAVATPDLFHFSGQTVAHFRVHEPLGAGGMGVVYRAEDMRLGRLVALKFLLPTFSLNAAAKARFIREAKSGAALDHPSLCTIHDVGTTDDGQLFLAMPLYSGETLHARLEREGPLPVSEALAIARQVAEGLGSAHGSGIVHRDLKPGNVMLLPDGGVKILDFGLAKARDQSVTETGARFGTVSYMAPEQVRGTPVDSRTDLWALGVVLHEMLTGRKPFDGDTEIAVAHAIIHDEPTPARAWRTNIPVEVEDVILQLLQKDPAARYASAAALLEDLGAVEQGAGRATHWFGRRRRHVRQQFRAKRRWIAAAGAALAVGAVAYAAVAGTRVKRPAAPARTAIAVLPFQNLSAQGSHAYFAGALHDEILTQLYKVPALRVIGRTSVMGYHGLNPPPLQRIARELEVGSVVEGSVQVVGEHVRVNVQLTDAATEAPLWVEQYDRTLDDALALQGEMAQQIVATVGVVLGSAERNALTTVPTEKAQAYLLYLQGKEIERRPDRRQENLAAAARLYERAIALDSGFALAHAALAGTHGWMYLLRYDMTPARLARQRAEAETAVRLAPNLPETHQAMGAALNVGPNTNPHEALKQWQVGLRSAPNDVRLIRHTASFYRQTGNWEEYERAFQRAVELDPRNVDFLADYGGDTHVRMGRFADAIRWYERAASITGDTIELSLRKAWIYRAWKGDMGPLRAWMHGEGGRVARRNGWIYPEMVFRFLERQPDSMLLVLKEARRSAFQSSFAFEPVALWSAAAHELRGDQRAARAAYDSALSVADSGIRKYADDFSVHQARGMALAGLGRRAEALDEVERIRQNFLYKDHWVRETMLRGIARIHALLGDGEATVAELEQILSQRYTGLTIHVLRSDPGYDRVRDHPRFRALLSKYANHPNLRS
jgi:TolB-like protein/Flp pilus assembly protein TadD